MRNLSVNAEYSLDINMRIVYKQDEHKQIKQVERWVFKRNIIQDKRQ